MGALGTNPKVAIAFNRFGLGGRPDDPVPVNPGGWALAQLSAPDPYVNPGISSTASVMALMAQFVAGNESVTTQLSAIFNAELASYMGHAILTRAPFRERLVAFWSNHLTTVMNGWPVLGLAGAYVREVIRPNVTGSFTTMLLAAMQHPAMLWGLTNVGSAGPQSPVAQGSVTGAAGFNENLGRECLELYTLGINANYSQADVDGLAYALTGWTVNCSTQPYGFSYNPAMHQPGNQVIYGRSFAPTYAGTVAALTYLATHPQTYLHLATKLVTHFISDTPAPSDVATVYIALSSTHGNLGAAAAKLVGLPSAWTPFSKLRSPFDYVVAVMRAINSNGQWTVNGLLDPGHVLGQLHCQPWQPPFPNGYSDLASTWATPARLLAQNDWTSAACTQMAGVDPSVVAASAIGPLLQPATLAAVNAASNPHDKLFLLFRAPEFQRR